MGKKLYSVMIPIAGHVQVDVEAASEEEAIAIALDGDLSRGDLTWEVLDRFTRGNVCYCPQPWEVEAEEIDAGEDEE